MSEEPKRRNATTMPQAGVLVGNQGIRLIKKVMKSAFMKGICSRDAYRELLAEHPELTELHEKTAEISDEHLPALWSFVTARPWWETRLAEDADPAELTFMADILRYACEMGSLTTRELIRIVGADRLSRYLFCAPASRQPELEHAVKAIFTALGEKEYIALQEVVSALDMMVFIRAFTPAAMYADIIVPLAERLGWIKPPQLLPKASPPAPPAASTTVPVEKPSSALVAAGLLQRSSHQSSPLLRAVRVAAERLPQPGNSESPLPLTTQKPHGHR